MDGGNARSGDEHEDSDRVRAVLDEVMGAYRAWQQARDAERAARSRFVRALRGADGVVGRALLSRALGISRTRVKQILERPDPSA